MNNLQDLREVNKPSSSPRIVFRTRDGVKANSLLHSDIKNESKATRKWQRFNLEHEVPKVPYTHPSPNNVPSKKDIWPQSNLPLGFYDPKVQKKKSRILRNTMSYSLFAKRLQSRAVRVDLLGFPPLRHLVGQVFARTSISPINGVRVEFTDSKNRPLNRRLYLNLGGMNMTKQLEDYFARYALDDNLLKTRISDINSGKHYVVQCWVARDIPEAIYQGGAETSIYDPNYLDLDKESSSSDEDYMSVNGHSPVASVRFRHKVYAIGETLAALVGSVNTIREYKRSFKRWPIGMIARSVHSFFSSMRMRSSVEFLTVRIGKFLGGHNEWEYEAFNEIEFLCFLVSIPFQSSSGSGRVSRALANFKKSGGTLDTKDMMQSGVRFCLWLWQAGMAAFETKSFQPFFHSGSSWMKWLSEASKVKSDYNYFETGDIGFQEYFYRLDKVIHDGDSILKALSNERTSSSFNLVHKELCSVKAILDKEALMKRVRQERQPCFFLPIYGNAGSGKTSSLKFLLRHCLEAAGDKYETDRIHTHNPTDKYDSGLRTYHNAIVVDDIGSVVRDISGDAALSGLRLVMEVANSVPVASTQAAVESKGMIFAHPKIVVLTSNDPLFGVRGVLTTPNAYLRRLGFRVHLHVKPEYAKPGSNMLDIKKIPQGKFVIPHLFSVIKFNLVSIASEATLEARNGVVTDKTQEDKLNEELFLNKVEAPVFLRWLKEEVVAHFKGGANMLSCLDSALKAPICQHCFFPGCTGSCQWEEGPEDSSCPWCKKDACLGSCEPAKTWLEQKKKSATFKETHSEIERVMEGACSDSDEDPIDRFRRSSLVRRTDHAAHAATRKKGIYEELLESREAACSDSDDDAIEQFRQHGIIGRYEGSCISAMDSALVKTTDRALALKTRAYKAAVAELWRRGQQALRFPDVLREFKDHFLRHHSFYRIWPEISTFVTSCYLLSRTDKFDSETERILRKHEHKLQLFRRVEKLFGPPLENDPKLKKKLGHSYEIMKREKEIYLQQMAEKYPDLDLSEAHEQSAKVQDSHAYLRKLDAQTPRNVWLEEEKQDFMITDKNRSLKIVDFISLVEKNLVLMEGSSHSQGFFICSNVLITVKHILDCDTLEIYEKGGKRSVGPGSWKILGEDPSGELSMISIEGFQKKDLTHLLPLSLPDEIQGSSHVISLTFNHANSYPGFHRDVLRVKDRVVRALVSSGTETSLGDCGSIYFTTINRATPVLFGMHFAGMQGGVAAQRICWSDFSNARIAIALMKRGLVCDFSRNGLKQCKNLPFKRYDVEGSKAYPKNSTISWMLEKTQDIPSEVTLHGTIDYSVGGPWKTRITPSKLQGLVPPSMKQPPEMRSVLVQDYQGEHKSFTQVRLAHYNIMNNLGKPDVPHLKLATEIVKRRHAKILNRYEKVYPLTEETSLNGLDGVRFVDKIKQKTGAGLPNRGPKTDSLIMGTPEALSYTPMGRASCQYIADCLMSGINPGIIFDINFKDEVKKPDKPIRTFAACPAPYNELMRRIFLIPTKLLQENYLLSGMSIGIDCNSRQWAQIYEKHAPYKFHTLWDFKFYDKSHTTNLLEASSEVMISDASCCYRCDATVAGYPVLLLYARGLAAVNRPVYAYKDSIFQVDGTLASGAFLTAQENSVIQEILLECAWIEFVGPERVEEEFLQEIDSFDEETVSDRFGDDGMMSNETPGFQLPFLEEFFAKSNIVMTSPTKDGTTPDNFRVSEWSYLKRGFLPLDGVVWCPIEEESILKNINWKNYAPTLTDEQAHMEFVAAALQECARCGDDRFEDLYANIVDAYAVAFPGSIVKFRTYMQEKAIQKAALQVDKDGSSCLWKIARKEANEFCVEFRRSRRGLKRYSEVNLGRLNNSPSSDVLTTSRLYQNDYTQ